MLLHRQFGCVGLQIGSRYCRRLEMLVCNCHPNFCQQRCLSHLFLLDGVVVALFQLLDLFQLRGLLQLPRHESLLVGAKVSALVWAKEKVLLKAKEKV